MSADAPARGIELELDMARNFHGPLSEGYRKLLRDLYEDPTPERWGRCNGIMLRSTGRHVTLWQALLVVDPENTPRVGPTTRMHEEPQWTWAPTREAIKRALEWATH